MESKTKKEERRQRKNKEKGKHNREEMRVVREHQKN
jgi:hypothetical protein